MELVATRAGGERGNWELIDPGFITNRCRSAKGGSPGLISSVSIPQSTTRDATRLLSIGLVDVFDF